MQSGCAREKRRDWKDCADALSSPPPPPPLLFTFTNTHTLTPTRKHAHRGPLPLAVFAVRMWRLSPAHSEAGCGGRRRVERQRRRMRRMLICV